LEEIDEIKKIYGSNLKEMLIQRAIIDKKFIGVNYLDFLDAYVKSQEELVGEELKDFPYKADHLKYLKKGYVKDGELMWPTLGLDVKEIENPENSIKSIKKGI